MTRAPKDPTDKKSFAFKAAIKAVEEMGAAAAEKQAAAAAAKKAPKRPMAPASTGKTPKNSAKNDGPGRDTTEGGKKERAPAGPAADPLTAYV